MSEETNFESGGNEGSASETTVTTVIPQESNESTAKGTFSTSESRKDRGGEKTSVGVFAQNKGIEDLSKAQPKVGRPLGSKNVPKVEAPQEAYEPNYKFKILDQELEMDEWLRPFVKNKEIEQKIRDMVTKAYGLPKIKEERDQTRTQFDQFKTQVQKDYTPVVQRHQMLSNMAAESRQNGDWTKFFQAAQIPAQDIIKWAAKTVAHLEANPNYLEKEKKNFEASQQIQHIQTQNQTLQQQMQELQMARQQLELDYSLNANETKEFAQIFDARVGKPGAFRQEVINRGAMIEMSEGRVATAQEIVGNLIKLYGGVPKAEAPVEPIDASQEQAPSEGTQEARQGSGGKPVLPNIKGRSTSPAKSVIKSTDDLRKLRTQLAS